MSSYLILGIVILYFLVLFIISRLTAGKGDNDTFFVGNRKSPWYVVAFGMIGASLSGVTFISVPGWVDGGSFSYMQMVLGYLAGYAVIALVLLPIYYRMNLTSIYTYLEERFGLYGYKTGAWYFIVSRIIGASFRLYLVAMVFHEFILKQMGITNIPFEVIVIISILLIWLYTNKGGIKTVIWTDTLQTTFMLAAVVITILGIKSLLNLDFAGLYNLVSESSYSKIFFFDDFLGNSKHFVKFFFSGMFITIAMTGLDQDMMQKNLTCKSLKDAQKNMLWFSITLIFVNLIFLVLGALLYKFAYLNCVPEVGDRLFPAIAFLPEMGIGITIFFVLGLIAAAYSSADSALTSLTTSFTIDILGKKPKDSNQKMVESNVEFTPEEELKKTRRKVHIGMSIALMIVVIVFNLMNDDSVIKKLFQIAGYTYGPLLGLYAFGIFTKHKVKDNLIPIVAILSPIICIILNENSMDWFHYKVSFELLIINGLLTYFGLYLIRNKTML